MRDDRSRLLDILEAIEKIKRYSGIGKETYEHDELIQTWMVHHIQVIGEAVARLSDDFLARHPIQRRTPRTARPGRPPVRRLPWAPPETAILAIRAANGIRHLCCVT